MKRQVCQLSPHIDRLSALLCGFSPGEEGGPAIADDLKYTRLRILGLIDQMTAGVARIDELGIALRDIPTGLVDFPALVNGRQIWLCWRRDEDAIHFWHDLDSGFGGRRPLIELT